MTDPKFLNRLKEEVVECREVLQEKEAIVAGLEKLREDEPERFELLALYYEDHDAKTIRTLENERRINPEFFWKEVAWDAQHRQEKKRRINALVTGSHHSQ